MAHSQSKPRVLIIGAGLGGLALAQSLRKQGIPYDLFERDASEAARFQGWAISLHPWFMKDLLEATKHDMPALKTVGTTYELGISGEGAIFNGSEELARFGAGSGEDFIRADRAKMREWLLTHLDVHWNKRFTHYEEDTDGVVAKFGDGSSYRGDILVGCDGVSSHVRSQLIPSNSPQYVPMGLVVGEVEATEDQYKSWMRIAKSFFITNAAPRRIFVGLKSVATDRKTARYYWMFGWTDTEATKESFWTKNASQAELHDFVMNRLDGVDPRFVEIIRQTPVEGMLHPPLRLKDMAPVNLPKGRVTLMGDSIHPMVPFRGEGGNMAMKDGFTLASCIENGGDKAVEDILKDYEDEMIRRTAKSVHASRAAGDPAKQ